MNYLEKYGLSKEDIDEIIEHIDQNDYLEFNLKEDKICSIIDYLVSIGVTNIKELIMYKSYIFYELLEVIKNKIRKEIVPYINEDIAYLDMIGI